MSIETICLDIGGVLLNHDYRIIQQKIKSMGGHISLSLKLLSRVKEFELGRLSSEQFLELMIEQYKLKLDHEQLTEVMNCIFDEIPKMKDVILKLSKKFNICLASNTNALHFEYILKEYPYLEQMKPFILSYKIGFRKPDPMFYKEMLQILNRAPEEILFIDNNKSNIRAASRFNILTHHFIDVNNLKTSLNELGAEL